MEREIPLRFLLWGTNRHPQGSLVRGRLSACRVQHILDENPISRCRVIDQHMGVWMMPTPESSDKGGCSSITGAYIEKA